MKETKTEDVPKQRLSHSSELPKSWENKILTRFREGGIHLVSSKGHGKSVAKMQIVRHFSEREDTKIVIFDTLPNWQHKFDSIPFFVVTKDMVKRKSTTYALDSDTTYIMTEKDYYLNKEPFQILEQNHKVLLFSIEIQNPTEIGIFISEIISHVYNKQRIKAKHKGIQNLKTWYLFVIEEVENVFDSSSMEKRAFNRIRKQYSEMANLKMACISSSQRLQEVSTKFRGKMNYLIGRISIEDFDLKLRRLLHYSTHRKEVLNLPLGCFLNAKTDELVQFEDFKQHGKPYQISKPRTKPESKRLARKPLFFRILNRIQRKPREEDYFIYNYHETTQTEEDREFNEEEKAWSEFLIDEEEWSDD